MTPSPEPHPFGRDWLGAWIGADDRPAVAGESRRVAFRRRVELDDVPATLPIRVSADSRYVLWVNGVEIGRGPSRSQPHRRTADEYDIAGALVEGANVIAALVTYYGADNAHWQRARVSAGLGAAACLIVDAPATWAEFATGPEWIAATADAWTAGASPAGISALPIEIVNERLLDSTWRSAEGSDPAWRPARRQVPTHPGPHRASPPAYPFGALPPRGMAALGGETVVAREESVRVAPPTASDVPDDAVPVDAVHAALAGAHGTPPTQYRAAAPDAPLLWIFDFGRVVSGFVELDGEVPAGTVLDLAYLERPFDPAGDNRYVPRAGARIVAAGGRVAFRALETNGMKIAAVLVTPPAAAEVKVIAVRVREQLYPIAGDASFRSSDPDLERLWYAGRRTVQLNSSDALTDCPTREQRAWVGDGVVHLGVQLATNEDWRLVERHLELCDSPRPDGLLPMSVVGDFESGGRSSIPDWSLHWIHGLWLYARASRRAEFVRARLATAEGVLAWFARYLVDGVLADVPEWTLIDWSSVFTSGRSSILTALWARGLAEFAELADWLGDAGRAAWARRLRAEVDAGFEQFWDAARGVYVDHIVAGIRQPAVSQASLAAALVAGLVPADRHAAIVATMLDESRLVSRGWNAPSPTVSVEQRVRDRAAGVQRIDWDVEREIVRAEPFFSAVVHDAVAVAGRADLMPGLLRRWLRFLTDDSDTFGECWDWGSPAHGWSSTPTSDLITHVLGVAPLGFADDGYRIAPARTAVSRLAAGVPTRAGLLEVDLTDGVLVVATPLPVIVETWAGAPVHLPPGRHTVNLAADGAKRAG